MQHRNWLEQNLGKGAAKMEILTKDEEKKEIERIVDEIMVENKTAGSWKRKVLIAAAVVMIGIPVFGFAFPALAQHIPIIGGLFVREDIHQHESLVALDRYSSVIGKTQTVDGISITLEEVYFDGGSVYAAFLLESEEPIRSDIDFFNWPRVFVDGSEVEVNSSGFESHEIDDYTVMLVQRFTVDGTFTGSEEIDIEINIDTLWFETGNYTISEYGRVTFEREVISTGGWSFNFPVAATAFEIIEVNQVLQHEGVDITLERIIVSPTSMRIYYSVESELPMFILGSDWENVNNERRFDTVFWFIEDDSGVDIESKGGGFRQWQDGGRYLGRGDETFNRPRDGSNQLIIMPQLILQDGPRMTSSNDVDYSYRVDLEHINIDLP